MPIIVKDNRREFTPAPEGLHQGVCVDVIDLGLQPTQWGEKQRVEIRWQLDLVEEETARRFMVMNRYTTSLNEKANLRKHLEAWRGKRFSKEELEGFDLEKLLGVNCQIQVIHNVTDNGGTFANVQALVPLGKGMVKIRASDDYVRVIDREPKTSGTTATAAQPADEEAVPF